MRPVPLSRLIVLYVSFLLRGKSFLVIFLLKNYLLRCYECIEEVGYAHSKLATDDEFVCDLL